MNRVKNNQIILYLKIKIDFLWILDNHNKSKVLILIEICLNRYKIIYTLISIKMIEI